MEGCSVLQVSVSATNSSPITFPRRTANFHPSVWGDHFLRYAFRDDPPKETCKSRGDEEEQARLKEEVRKMLVGISDKSRRKIELIDKIQRLGLSYQFETEIDTSLGNIYDDVDSAFEDADDLYVVSLRFRLLRQTGRYVSSDETFKKFMNSEGKVEESKINDLKGILSLYEASNFRVDGEKYLEEAFLFTTSKLESMAVANELSHFHAIQVKQALNQPIQKSLTRLRGLQNISMYQEHESRRNLALLDFAKLDFNILQKQHQLELCELTKWWNELNCATNFPFARDRLVESYFWTISVYFEPRYGFGRNFLTKIITLSSILDDMYDAYATLDELQLFTAAIERWDIETINELPMYMRQLYRTILHVHDEMEEELNKSGKSYTISYAKEEMKKLARVYIQEANWCQNAHVPTFNECMKVSLASCGYLLLATAAMVGMGDSATKKCFDWVSNNPPILQAASVICRLTDDIVGYESEKERGDVAFCVEGYMKEFDVSKEEAKQELWKLVKSAWKDINRECLTENSIPMAILERILNLARVMDLMYREEDGYTNSRTKSKELIAILLVDPIV